MTRRAYLPGLASEPEAALLGLPLIINDEAGGPPWEIWHTGGSGGPIAMCESLENARMLCAMSESLLRLARGES